MAVSLIYPFPPRYLLNKMASSGDIDTMLRMGTHLSSKVKKEVSFDNRLCNAYLSAGQGAQFLRMLEADLDSVLLMANPAEEDVQSLKDRFPRGGAMGLLEGNAELVDDYARLAGKFVHLGYVAPVNVLWTYYFINAQHDK